MKENLHDIDKLFKDAIEQHSDSPGDDVWKSIENKLDKSNVVSINKKYQRLKRIAAVLLLLLGAAAVYEVVNYKNNNSKNNYAAGNNKTKNITEPANVVKTNPAELNNKNDKSLPANFDSVNILKNNNVADKNNPATANKNLHSKTSRSGSMQFAGDSLEQKNNNAVIKSDDVNLDNKQNRRSIKTPRSKSNMISNITNGNIGVVEDKNNPVTNVEEPLKNYYEFIQSSSYQNKFDWFLTAPLSTQKNILTPTVKPAPEKNIVKTSVPKNKIKKSLGFSLTPFYSPDFAFNTLKDDHPHQGPGRRDDKHDIKNDEKHGYASTAGLLAEVLLSKKLSLQSGLSVSTSSTNTQAKNIYAEKDAAGNTKYRVNASCGYGYIPPPPNTNPAIGDSIKALNAKNTLQYLSIPLALKYSVAMGKLSFVSSAGVQINFLTKGQIKTTTDNGSIKQTQAVNTVEGLKKSYMSAIISAGIQYSVSKKVDLQFLPAARIGLNSINNGATVKTFSNAISLSAGLKIKL